ncbi:MAG: replicative DNA helicase [Dehalococcoidia bacterium]|nr:replicative DNA helicase [Dehalococcoidia bacterium]
MAENGKLPPHNVEAEEAVLGSLLVDPESIAETAIFLKPEAFYREKNLWVYEACLALYDRSEAINQITVAQELATQGRLEAVGGAGFLSLLVERLPTSLHVEHYARIVHRLYVDRRLISAAGQIAAIGYEADADLDSALNKAEDALFRVRRGESPRDFVHIRPILEQYWEERIIAGAGLEDTGRPQHVDTGFPAVDDLLGGMQRSDMVILAARTTLGKTSLALGIARNAALEQGANVAIFSLEMSKETLVRRLLSMEAEVDSRRVLSRQYTPLQEKRVMDATGKLSGLPIYIDDSPTLRVVEMRGKARRLHQERGIDLIIVDYLQMVRGDGRSENKVQEISDISRGLKGLAREMNCPVLALSQLSRAVEQRPSHVPMLSDLRESGSIEQDADVVMFIHRDDKYFSREEWDRMNPDRPYPEGIANIIIAKHRNGPQGQRNLRFREEITRFENCPVEAEIEQPALPRFSG